MEHDHDDLQELLDMTDPATFDYDDWLRVGMGLHTEGYPLDVWESWSARDQGTDGHGRPRYRPGVCAEKWESFANLTSPPTGATVAHICEAHGADLHHLRSHAGDEGYGYHDVVTFTANGFTVSNGASSAPKAAEAPSIPVEPAPEPVHFKVTDRAAALAAYAIEEPTDPEGECSTWLRVMFDPGDHLCVLAREGESRLDGGKWRPYGTGRCDLTAGEVIDRVDAGESLESVFGTPNEAAGAWCTINPCDGAGRGYDARTGTDHVPSFRHTLIECDDMPLDETIAALEKLHVPVSAVWYSGSKSIHAALRVDAADRAEHRARTLEAYGWLEAHGLRLDKANKDPSRLCRLPGFRRGDRWQRLLRSRPFDDGCESWDEWGEWRAAHDASASATHTEAHAYDYSFVFYDGAPHDLDHVRYAERRPAGDASALWVATDGGVYDIDGMPFCDPATGEPLADDPWTPVQTDLDAWLAANGADAGGVAEAPAKETEPVQTPAEKLADACSGHRHGIWTGSDVIDGLADLRDAADPWPLDLQGLNRLMGGAVPGAVTVILAQSGTGKTTLLVQEMVSLAASGRPVILLTGEQAASELVAKTLSSRIWTSTGANAGGLRVTAAAIRRASARERWCTAERRAFDDAVGWYRDAVAPNLYFLQPDGRPSLTDLEAAVSDVADARGEAPAIGVDYLQILGALDPKTRDPERLIIDKNVTKLRQLARDFRAPVWVISSMNRNSYEDGAVTMAAAKESGGIEYGSDLLLGLQAFGICEARDECRARGESMGRDQVIKITHDCFDRDDGLRPLEVAVLKNRDGPAGGHAPLTLWLESSTYTDYDAPPSARRVSASSLMEKPCSLTL